MKELILKLKEKKSQLEKEIETLNQYIIEKKAYFEKLNKVKRVLKEAIINGNELVKKYIEDVVSDGLKIMYDDLSFKIENVNTAGKVGYNFKIGKSGHYRSLLCFGGGIRNVVSTILRFVAAKYINIPFVFLLDEVGSNISKEYQTKFGILLETFSKKFGYQIILITHQERIAEVSNNLIEINLDKDKSIVYEKRLSI